jgi:flavin reductase (DIM6/NTAB) family NADH-FMN oxidoreductase RutF
MATVAHALPDIDDVFRSVAGQHLSSVAIVVALDGDRPLATTAGSIVTASWNPPVMLVLFRTGSRMDRTMQRAGRFTINMLGATEHGLARRFSRSERAEGWDGFAGVRLHRRDPAPPVLLDALTWFDCAVERTLEIGDHRCFAGRVLDAHRDAERTPLAYYRGRYHELGASVAPPAWQRADPDSKAMW